MPSSSPLIHHQSKHHHHPSEHPHRTRLPVIPDLRFEPSYLGSIRPYVHIRGMQSRKGKDVDLDGEMFTGKGLEKAKTKGKEKDTVARKHQLEISPLSTTSSEVLHIQWGSVVWITTRDQIISPLLQGALWGVASHFLNPVLSLVGARIGTFFRSHLPPPGEGLGVGWLRSWIRGLGLSHSGTAGGDGGRRS